MPNWWIPADHDRDLLRGVSKCVADSVYYVLYTYTCTVYVHVHEYTTPYDAFWPMAHLISCNGVTESGGITCCACATLIAGFSSSQSHSCSCISHVFSHVFM